MASLNSEARTEVAEVTGREKSDSARTVVRPSLWKGSCWRRENGAMRSNGELCGFSREVSRLSNPETRG